MGSFARILYFYYTDILHADQGMLVTGMNEWVFVVQ